MKTLQEDDLSMIDSGECARRMSKRVVKDRHVYSAEICPDGRAWFMGGYGLICAAVGVLIGFFVWGGR